MSTSHSKGKRGKSFSIEEDEALCYAWLAISQDPAIGVGQKDTRFWNRIREHFSEAMTGNDSRTLCSIQNRWDKIRKDCSKYRGCLSQIEHRHLTGATLSDKVTQAKIMYAKENKDKPFLLDHCWKILQDSQKWWMETPADPVASSPGTSDYPGTPISLDSDQDPNPYSVNSPPRASKRPTGRKAEKESRRKSKIVEEDDSVFISLLQKFNQNAEESKLEKKLVAEQRLENLKAVEAREQRKLAVLETAELREQMKHDSAIMALDTTNMSPELQHYYKMLKNEIMPKCTHVQTAPSFIFLPLLIRRNEFMYYLLLVS